MSTEPNDRVLTVANIITFTRLMLVPAAFVLLISGDDVAATILLVITASTDFLDGLVARKTNSVTKLGQLLDPLVDRVLVISVVIGLLVTDKLPLWVIVLVLVRDAYLLAGGAYLLRRHSIRIPVSYMGKICMWLLCIGLIGLVLDMPLADGLGLVSAAWLPGISDESYCLFIWLVYAGLVLSLITTIRYTIAGAAAVKAKNSPANTVLS